VWEWKREKGGYITQQMRRLGEREGGREGGREVGRKGFLAKVW
jgi:hypothetical protein